MNASRIEASNPSEIALRGDFKYLRTLYYRVEDTTFFMYYKDQNKYSFNPLIGAIEIHEKLKSLRLILSRKKNKLLQSIQRSLKNHQKVFLGVSFFTTQIWEMRDLIKKIREKFKDRVFIIGGGPHPSGDPKGTLRLGVDVVVVGEGEETLCMLLENVIEDRDLGSVKGIAYMRDDDIIFTGKRKPIDLDDYPPFPIKNKNIGPIEITRGCPYLCYFCQTPHISGTKPRHRSLESILKYVRYLKQDGLTDIRFITPNAFSYGSKDGKEINPDKIEKLLVSVKREIGPRGKIYFGSFPSEVRPEHVNERTLGLVLDHASNDNLIIGAQSGSPRMLKACHRGHSVQDVKDAVGLIIQKGLKVNVDFIFGLPGEKEEDIELSIQMMKEIAKKGAIIHTHYFMPLPNTPFEKREVKDHVKQIQTILGRLARKGSAYGSWQKQKRQALKISRYLREGEF